MEVGDLSTDQEIKKSEQDSLFTRFVELFKDFFYKSPVTLQHLNLDLPKLQKIFHHSWDKKAPPSKSVLMKAVHLLPGPMSFAGASEDDVREAFAAALEALDIEEHDSEKAETTRLEETDGYVFRLNGDVWTIVYEGREFPPIKNESGMSLISHLLFHRGTVFQSPLDLEAAIDGSPREFSFLDDMTREQLEKEGFSTQGLVDRQGPDKTAFQAYKKRLDEIDDDLAEAAINNDLAQKSLLSGQREALLREMKNFVIRAQKGPQEHREEKARKRVSSAIHRALTSIEGHEPEDFGLIDHLRKHLTPISFPYSYDPEQPIDWTI